jgi:hypothetical protein
VVLRAAPDDVAAAVRGDGGGGLGAVLLVRLGVGDVEVDEDVGRRGHRAAMGAPDFRLDFLVVLGVDVLFLVPERVLGEVDSQELLQEGLFRVRSHGPWLRPARH